MDQLAPDGPVYQAGTLSGNPVALSAGLATLELVSAAGFFEALAEKTRALTHGLEEAARQAGIPFTSNQVGGMFGLFFSDAAPITGLAQVMAADQERFKRFFHGMLQEGVYLAASAFEAGFMSAAHTATEIEHTLDAAARVFKTLA